MSSTHDEIECPRCGAIADREQDNRSGEVNVHCPRCNWDGSNNDTIDLNNIQFICPDCGEDALDENIINANVQRRIENISENYGNCDFDQNPEIYDGDVTHYSCSSCGYEIKDKKGNLIQDYDDLIEWLLGNCEQE
jgi:hypothetical protein